MQILQIVGIVLVFLLTRMFSSEASSIETGKTLEDNVEMINELIADFDTELAIPQVIQGYEGLKVERVSNSIANLYAGENQLQFASFQDVKACPMGVYLNENVHDAFYTINNSEVKIDYVRIRITEDKQYISYKYLNTAYTLMIGQKLSLGDALGYLGLKESDIVETQADKLNELLGVKQIEIEDDSSIMNQDSTQNNNYGKYQIGFNAEDFGLSYGIDTDESVNFYLDNKLLMKVTDKQKYTDESQINKQIYEQEHDDILLILYNQQFDIGTPEYQNYINLITVIDGLQKNIRLSDYAS